MITAVTLIALALLGNRMDCDAIRGTEYVSWEERDWYWSNCLSRPLDSIRTHLARIAQCESGGNPAAVSPDGQFRGKYQFLISTWYAVGGLGLPDEAPEWEQDQRAYELYLRAGPGQWPVCQWF